MATSTNKRLWVSLAYLGLLFGTCWWLYTRLLHFEGQLFLARGAVEHLVVGPHRPGPVFGLLQRNVPADLLLFDNGRAAERLGQEGRFDGAYMPAGLRFESLEITSTRPDRHVLDLEGPGGKATRAIETGSTITIDGRTCRIDGIHPWEGLVRHPRGQAMATVRLGGSLLFLEGGTWSFPTSDTAVQFQWHENEASARSALIADREQLAASARWGVRDGEAIQWFQGVAPGSGLVLRNGTEVTLVKSEAGMTALHVRMEDEHGAKTLRVAANAAPEDGPVYYQNPALASRVFVLHAWEEGEALVQCFGANPAPDTRTLRVGDSWTDGNTVAFQLDQVMAGAIPVTRAAGQLTAVELSWDDGSETLPEGQVKTLLGVRLAYRREAQTPDARIHLVSVAPDGTEGEAFSLPTGGAIRRGMWTFSAPVGATITPNGVILSASRRPGGWGYTLGLLLFGGGAVGLTAIRFRKRPPA